MVLRDREVQGIAGLQHGFELVQILPEITGAGYALPNIKAPDPSTASPMLQCAPRTVGLLSPCTANPLIPHLFLLKL